MNRFFLTALFLLFCACVFAQFPQKLSYQAVIRDGSNSLVLNQNVGIRVSVLQGSISGVSVYIETHSGITNNNGLLTLEIGSGTVFSGNFSQINWGNGPYFVKTEIDPNGGGSYAVTSTSQLLSVPYALHAKTAESLSGPLNENDPVFLSSVAAGITIADTAYWNRKLDTEIDGSVTNELQVLSQSNDTIFLSNGGFAVIPPDQNWMVADTNLYNANNGSVGIGTATPQEKLEVAGRAKVQGLQVGNGNMFKSMQGGKVLVGQSFGQALIFVDVVFPTPFVNPPNVICTASAEPGTIYDDSFDITVRFITNTGFQMIVNRVDGSTWGQNTEAFWFAFE